MQIVRLGAFCSSCVGIKLCLLYLFVGVFIGVNVSLHEVRHVDHATKIGMNLIENGQKVKATMVQGQLAALRQRLVCLDHKFQEARRCVTFKAWHGDLKDGYAQKIEDPWDKRNNSQQKKVPMHPYSCQHVCFWNGIALTSQDITYMHMSWHGD